MIETCKKIGGIEHQEVLTYMHDVVFEDLKQEWLQEAKTSVEQAAVAVGRKPDTEHFDRVSEVYNDALIHRAIIREFGSLDES